MSHDKAIEHGKEKRRPYRGAKAIDCSCRNHGSCAYCRSSRTIQLQREELRTKDQTTYNDET